MQNEIETEKDNRSYMSYIKYFDSFILIGRI